MENEVRGKQVIDAVLLSAKDSDECGDYSDHSDSGGGGGYSDSGG